MKKIDHKARFLELTEELNKGEAYLKEVYTHTPTWWEENGLVAPNAPAMLFLRFVHEDAEGGLVETVFWFKGVTSAEVSFMYEVEGYVEEWEDSRVRCSFFGGGASIEAREVWYRERKVSPPETRENILAGLAVELMEEEDGYRI